MVTIRILRWNIIKFLVLFVFSALIFRILIKIIRPDTRNASLYNKKYFEGIMKEAMTENSERIARVQMLCRKYKMGSFSDKNYEVEFKDPPTPQYNVLYIDSLHNISYCPIYKSGSTSWIYNLCLLNGITEEELLSGREQISVIARRVMPELDYPEADEFLHKTMKLLIVRHPFERLLSAYRDKLENSVDGREHGTLYFDKKYNQAIVRKYRDKSHPAATGEHVIRRPGQRGPAGTEATWREFVDYIIATDLASYADDHWMPYYLYCTPCLINYDFIAKVETLERDQTYIIHRMGLADKIRPLWKHKIGSTDAAAVYFKQLTKEHVRKLHDKFKLDLELFGYSTERYYDFAVSST